MRYITSVSAFFAVATLAFIACNNQASGIGDEIQQNVLRTSIGIIAGIKSPETTPDTKTIIEGAKSTGFEVSWQADDKLGVFTHSNNIDKQFHSLNELFEITGGINTDGRAAFAGNLNCRPDDAMYLDLYAYFPYNESNDGKDYSDVTGVVPTVQTMTADGSHHSGADIMIAERKAGIEIPQASTVAEPVSDFVFRYVVSFVNVSIDRIASGDDAPKFPVAQTEIIKSIKIGAAAAEGSDPILSGNVGLNLVAANAVPIGENSNHVVASWPVETNKTIADICGEGKLGAWFVTLPFSVGGESGNSLVITIETDKNRIVKKLLPVNTIEFIAGGVKTLNVAIDSNCEVTPAGDVFSETFGHGLPWTGETGSSTLGAYEALANGFDRGGWGGTDVSYSGDDNVYIRETESFNEHLYMSRTSGFTIAGISVGSVRDFTLGYKHCLVSGPSTTYTLSVSNDGRNWKPLTGTTGTVTATGTTYKQFSVLSAKDKIYLRFETSSAATSAIRIDDILLTAADGVQETVVDLNPIQVLL